MKVFVSYAHEDRVRVAEIKRQLEIEFGFDVFLAHEDIAPTHQWVEEILSELKTCNVFIAFLTRYSNNSDWTNQEVGFALARAIKIIPINAGANPHGFIGQFQALNFSTVQDVCHEIVKILAESPDLRETVINLLIKVFGESSTFKRAESAFDNLIEYEISLTTQQKDEIVRLAGTNDQIYRGFAARKKIFSFVQRYPEEINSEIVEAFRIKTES